MAFFKKPIPYPMKQELLSSYRELKRPIRETQRRIGVIRWPEQAVNFAFAGPDLRTLFCCAQTSVYAAGQGAGQSAPLVQAARAVISRREQRRRPEPVGRAGHDRGAENCIF
jgi:hypothetical protein